MKSFLKDAKSLINDTDKALDEFNQEANAFVTEAAVQMFDRLPEKMQDRISASMLKESELGKDSVFPDETKLSAFTFKQILTEPIVPGFYQLTDKIIICPPLFGVKKEENSAEKLPHLLDNPKIENGTIVE